MKACPVCGGRFQASVTVDCDIDDDGAYPTNLGGNVSVYCENDCDGVKAEIEFIGCQWPDANTIECVTEEAIANATESEARK